MRMYKNALLVILCLFQCLTINALNQKRLDSLNNELAKCEIDSNRVKIYFELGRTYEYFKSKERIEYFIDALKLAKDIQYDAGIKKVYPNLISNLYHRHINDVAMSYSIEYLQYLEKNGSKEEQLKFYNTYGNLLSAQKKYKVARYHYDKAYEYYKSKKEFLLCANVCNNISILLMKTNEYDSALVYNTISGEIYKVNHDSSAYANSILGLAEIMTEKGDLDTALEKAKEALKIYQLIKIDLGVVNTALVIGDIYNKRKDFENALVFFETAQGYAENFNFFNLKRDAFLGASKAYFGLHDYEKAYQAQLSYNEMNDLIAAETLEGKMLEMEVKYDISKKETLLKENEYQFQVQKKQRNYLLIIISTGFGLIIALGFAYRQKRKTNKIISEQKRLVDEKQKEIIDSITYARRIQNSLLPNEKHIEKQLNRLMSKK